MISEPLPDEDCKTVWRNYEIMRPSSKEPAQLLKLGEAQSDTVFGFAAQRAYGDFAVYNLYNSGKEKKSIVLPFAEAGLPDGVRCAVYDFWEDRVLGYATDSYATPELAGLSSSLLRFTPIIGNGPVLVGSNFHLSIGATEISSVWSAPDSVTVRFTDAGAREGNLTFYSASPLVAQHAVGCEIGKIQNKGKNLWSVPVHGRRWGTDASISLRVSK